MVTGDQETLSDGNLNAEKGEWKAALADGALPSISVDRLKGKVERFVGSPGMLCDRVLEG